MFWTTLTMSACTWSSATAHDFHARKKKRKLAPIQERAKQSGHAFIDRQLLSKCHSLMLSSRRTLPLLQACS